MSRYSVLASVLIVAAFLIPGQDARAQGFGGATAQGDALRAQGQYLRGMAWYNFGAARAAAIEVEAQAAWNRAVQADYWRGTSTSGPATSPPGRPCDRSTSGTPRSGWPKSAADGERTRRRTTSARAWRSMHWSTTWPIRRSRRRGGRQPQWNCLPE